MQELWFEEVLVLQVEIQHFYRLQNLQNNCIRRVLWSTWYCPPNKVLWSRLARCCIAGRGQGSTLSITYISVPIPPNQQWPKSVPKYGMSSRYSEYDTYFMMQWSIYQLCTPEYLVPGTGLNKYYSRTINMYNMYKCIQSPTLIDYIWCCTIPRSSNYDWWIGLF